MNRPSPLVRLLERRTRALRRQLSAAIAGKDVGVHQARVASRRLREAVPVLTEGLQHSKSGKAQRKIRRLTQALGAVRELDVTLHLIDELAERPGVPRAALAEVRALVIEDRERRRTVMLERLESVDTGKLARRLEAVRQALLHPTSGHNWRAALALRVAKRGRRLDKAIAEAGQIYAPEALHEVRIAAKKLRYSLEIADESSAVPCAETLRVIKRVQDALGRLHDLQILQHHVAAVGAAPRGRRSTPDAGLAVLSRLIEDECRHLHGRYVAQLPLLHEAVEAARRDIPLRLTPRGRENGPRGQAPPGWWTTLMAMLELFLIRHGVAEERGKDWLDDSKRPLTPEGIARLRKAAQGLNRIDVTFDQIVTSPLVRTRQTADVFSEELKSHPPIVTSDALAPAGTPAAVIQEITKHVRKARVALVGHEPNLGELAAQLIGARNPLEFKKGGICRIDFDMLPPKGGGMLRWFLTPKMLRALGE